MVDPDRSHTLPSDGLSFDDEVFIFGGTVVPWLLSGSNDYPEGTRYFQSNGDEYIKRVTGSNPSQNDYELQSSNGGSGTQCLPFWDNSGTPSNISLTGGQLDFWNSGGTQDNITIGSC